MASKCVKINLVASLIILGLGWGVFAQPVVLNPPPGYAGWGFEQCTLDGVGGNLEPGDNPDVLPSVFTIVCQDQDDDDFGIIVNKFLVNKLQIGDPATAPNSDITDLQIRFFNDVTGEKKWECTIHDPNGLNNWPIPHTRCEGSGPFEGQIFKGFLLPDEGKLRVEIRPSISNSPIGGNFGISIQVEGSEGDTKDDTGGAKKEFHGFKTGWLEDPIKESVEREFKLVDFQVEPIDVPASNLDPSDTKTVHKFKVDLWLDDKPTKPELNNTPLFIDNRAITFTLTGTGTFPAGCVVEVDIVDQQTNQSLIDGPRTSDDAGKSINQWGAGGRLQFTAKPDWLLNLLIPQFMPDDGDFHSSFSAEVRVHIAPPGTIPAACGTVRSGEPLQGRTPQDVTLDIDVKVKVTFTVTEKGKNKEVAQNITKWGIAPDSTQDYIFDRPLEEIAVGDWTFETLDQKETEKLDKSTVAKLTVTLTDRDSSNQDAVKIEQVEVLNITPPQKTCPDPGVTAIQIQDANHNVLGTGSGFGKIELRNPDGTGVILPDGDMDRPSSIELTIKLATRDDPPPDLPQGCKLMIKLVFGVIEGKVVQQGVEGKAYTIPLDMPEIRVPITELLVDVQDLQLQAGQLGEVPVTVNAFISEMTVGVVFDHDKLDARKLFDVVGVRGAGPYVVTASDISDTDLDGDGARETLVIFTVKLPSGATPALGPIAFIRGRAAEADVKDVLEELGVDMTVGVVIPPVTKPLDCNQDGVPDVSPGEPAVCAFDIQGDLVPSVVIATDPGIVRDPDPEESESTPRSSDLAKITIGSLTLPLEAQGALPIWVEAASFWSELRATLVLDADEGDARAVFAVEEVVSADPKRYKLQSANIRHVDVDGDGALETIVEFVVKLVGPVGEVSDVVHLIGTAKDPGFVRVFFLKGPTLLDGQGTIITVTATAGSIRVEEARARIS